MQNLRDSTVEHVWQVIKTSPLRGSIHSPRHSECLGSSAPERKTPAAQARPKHTAPSNHCREHGVNDTPLPSPRDLRKERADGPSLRPPPLLTPDIGSGGARYHEAVMRPTLATRTVEHPGRRHSAWSISQINHETRSPQEPTSFDNERRQFSRRAFAEGVS